MNLPGTVVPQLFQRKFHHKNALLPVRLKNFHVPGGPAFRPVGDAVKDAGVTVAVRLGVGIVAGGNAHHVLIGPAAQLGQTVDFHGAGVGNQNEFGALEHQDAGALGKFPVIADHGPHLHRPGGGVQLGHIKIVASVQNPLVAKIAGVDLGVGEHPAAKPVKKAKGVAGRRGVALQQGDAYRHLQLRRQSAERLHKVPVRRDGQLLDGRGILGKRVSAAPHLGKQRNVRPLRLGGAAGRPAFLQALGQIRPRRDL